MKNKPTTVKTFQYNNETVVLEKAQCGNGRIALSMMDVVGLPVATITTNIVDVQLNENEMCIKNYAENEGILEFLVRHNITTAPIRWESTGFVLVPVVELKPEEMWMYYKELSNEQLAELQLQYTF